MVMVVVMVVVPCYLLVVCCVLLQIFNCILSLRANERGQVGYQDESGVKYSYFYVCQK